MQLFKVWFLEQMALLRLEMLIQMLRLQIKTENLLLTIKITVQ